MFITFEGLDACGKTTQAKLLVEELKNSGLNILFLREPGGTGISEKIRQILLDREHLEMSDLAEFFLFSAARTQLVNEVIRPALDAGITVLCDRFYDSTTAYQGYGRGLDLEDVKRINRVATNGLAPDITFILDIPVSEILRRRGRSKGDTDRMESSGIEFYARVRQGYHAIAQAESSRCYLLAGTRKIQEIHEEILEIVQKKLSSK
jgi:dTMP kinase